MPPLRWAFPAVAAVAVWGFGVRSAEPARAILPGSAANALLKQCSRAVPQRGEGTWQPTAADIDRMEALLPAALAKAPQARELDAARMLNSWRRQYVGIVRNGKRFLYGNFFPRNDPQEHLDWRSRPIIVCDGGPAFFGAELDVAARRLTHLAFNGSPGP
jgi:hypothetical protein